MATCKAPSSCLFPSTMATPPRVVVKKFHFRDKNCCSKIRPVSVRPDFWVMAERGKMVRTVRDPVLIICAALSTPSTTLTLSESKCTRLTAIRKGHLIWNKVYGVSPVTWQSSVICQQLFFYRNIWFWHFPLPYDSVWIRDYYHQESFH